ncbi:U2 small nuclear ribonucleoprotein auxiliary factor 35 kDa subunit-related protein 2 [Euwallacea similis]|uniref:U2 small nuclear ribonucleoprotein auxiliary factor 35 kDa subunit-related protein 2 n=1 Tax=Euwallacea similis TaxID=1736056 RepID=UPI00344F9D8D
MAFLNSLSRHSQWRKVAKKLRRKRIRQASAQDRDRLLLDEQQKRESSLSYQKWFQEQQRIEQEQAKEEAAQLAFREEQWKKAEEESQKQWQVLQQKLSMAREEKMRQNLKIRLEWEREEKRLKELKRLKEKEIEEKRLEQQRHEQELLDFLEEGGSTPEHLKTVMESNPGKDLCPFFQKVSACRFFDMCSRNHLRPGISRTLLITNFFTDMSLQIGETEHGSDVSLEYELEDTYQCYKDFFLDVTREFEKCGSILRFLCCCNHELHLRGNVYVEYKTTREALVAYHKFNGRWYAGRQLNVQFCNVASWKAAICGLFFWKKCPKGNACNFLHSFENPGGAYMPPERRNGESTSRRRNDDSPENWDREICDGRNWRWSESPERSLNERAKSSKRRREREHGSRCKRRSRDRLSKRRRKVGSSDRKLYY